MLRLDLAYRISFTICHHARLRLIVWRPLLVKAFKHSNSGRVSCTAHRACSKSEMRWVSASCCFTNELIRLFGCGLTGLKAPSWPWEDTPAMGLDNCRSRYCGHWGRVRESQGGKGCEGALCWAGGWMEWVLLLFVGSFQLPVVTGPFLNSKSSTIFGQK